MENTSELSISPVDPKTLSDLEFQNLNEVTQDMWAYGIGEFVQCPSCSQMHSKHDIFGHLSKEVYEMTTAKIMRILDMQHVDCPSCGSETHIVFWEENVSNIKERLLESEDSFLIVCRNEQGGIVGYMDGYVDSLETIFQRELHYHYFEIWFEAVRTQVEKILGYVPPSLISFSSMWLVEKHTNFFTIFNMLRTFFHSIPQSRRNMAGITELDERNSLYEIYKTIGSRSLKINTMPEFQGKIQNTGKDYKSDLVVFHDPVIQSIERFSAGVRGYLKANRPKKREEKDTLLLAA